ncbi:hypothetical protein HF325_002230 [Metschnikowia pulcherrima]|uniref:Uncharacterized protein n=1 Tax=Metschnikowia pulcherrima TaxID=27326 RepID=A0A8H7LCX0_9ASCO|nr:hypothetical protein HF325_002230 [Metschnikowia pulcherrima]
MATGNNPAQYQDQIQIQIQIQTQEHYKSHHPVPVTNMPLPHLDPISLEKCNWYYRMRDLTLRFIDYTR